MKDKPSFFEKNGLFFAVLSLLLIFWLILILCVTPAHAATLEDLPSKLQTLPDGEFDKDYVLIMYHESSYGQQTLYVFESDPGIYHTQGGNLSFKNDVAYEYWYATNTWSDNGYWSQYRKWDSTTTIGESGVIYLNKNGAAISYCTMDIYNSDGSEIYYESDLYNTTDPTDPTDPIDPDLGAGESGGTDAEEDDTQDTIVTPIIDGIKDFFNWLFSPILYLVETITDWWETNTAFWDSLDISSISDVWELLSDITIEPVEKFFQSLNIDALTAFMQVWEFDGISQLIIAVVSILLIGGLIKLCMSL